jgi:flagellar basal body-associated protein FliL
VTPTLKENAVVRSVVTNDLTGLTTDELIQRPTREKLLTQILKDLQTKTDEKVTDVFFTDVVVQ